MRSEKLGVSDAGNNLQRMELNEGGKGLAGLQGGEMRRVENGERRTENGERRTENGERRTERSEGFGS